MRILAGILGFLLLTLGTAAQAAASQRILATTFPVYQIVRNVAHDVPGAEVLLMLPAQAGCPHDYALTPQDMTKLARADILVVNGLGMEAFLGSPSAHAKAGMITIDASQGIPNLLKYEEEAGDEAHEHGDVDPHLFASPRMAAAMTRSVAGQLAEADPGNAAYYSANADAYARKLDALGDELAALGKRLKNNRIVTQHGVFDYLARDMGLSVVAVVQADDKPPSAADMIRLVKAIREHKAGAVFTEPQYPDKIGATLARETGVPTARLDPAATGPAIAPLDYYEKTMRANMRTLEATLGTE